MGVSNNYFMLSLLDKNNNAFKYENNTFYIDHCEEYKIKISNDSSRRADATIYIDGKNVGKFRLEMYDHIVIERPSDKNKKFTFFAIDSIEGVKCDLKNTGMIGTIKVVIGVEEIKKLLSIAPKEAGHIRSCRKGGTGLGQKSSQQFSIVNELITDDDEIVLEAYMQLSDQIDHERRIRELERKESEKRRILERKESERREQKRRIREELGKIEKIAKLEKKLAILRATVDDSDDSDISPL
jgi:hypothetical protein